MYRNRLEFSRWLRASLGPKRSRVFECPGFFGSACSFAHSGGQSVIHRRNALSVGLTPPPGPWATIRPAMLPKKRTGRIADLNILLGFFHESTLGLIVPRKFNGLRRQ